MEKTRVDQLADIASSMAKIGANITEPKKESVKNITKDGSTGKTTTGNQTVHIQMPKLGTAEKTKTEYIYEFPQQRALTEAECNISMKVAQMDYDLKKSEQIWKQKMDERHWQHTIEMEKKDEKKRKIKRAVAFIFGALGIGAIGYSCYADYRDHKGAAIDPPKVPETGTVKGEGTVK